MSVLENAKSHFQEKGVKKITVAEWGDESGPLVIYAEPLNLADKARLYKKRQESEVMALAFVLIWFAKDADGKKLFTLEDKRDLTHRVDPNVLSRVATEILAEPSVEDMEKN